MLGSNYLYFFSKRLHQHQPVRSLFLLDLIKKILHTLIHLCLPLVSKMISQKIQEWAPPNLWWLTPLSVTQEKRKLLTHWNHWKKHKIYQKQSLELLFTVHSQNPSLKGVQMLRLNLRYLHCQVLFLVISILFIQTLVTDWDSSLFSWYLSLLSLLIKSKNRDYYASPLV